MPKNWLYTDKGETTMLRKLLNFRRNTHDTYTDQVLGTENISTIHKMFDIQYPVLTTVTALANKAQLLPQATIDGVKAQAEVLVKQRVTTLKRIIANNPKILEKSMDELDQKLNIFKQNSHDYFTESKGFFLSKKRNLTGDSKESKTISSDDIKASTKETSNISKEIQKAQRYISYHRGVRKYINISLFSMILFMAIDYALMGSLFKLFHTDMNMKISDNDLIKSFIEAGLVFATVYLNKEILKKMNSSFLWLIKIILLVLLAYVLIGLGVTTFTEKVFANNEYAYAIHSVNAEQANLFEETQSNNDSILTVSNGTKELLSKDTHLLLSSSVFFLFLISTYASSFAWMEYNRFSHIQAKSQELQSIINQYNQTQTFQTQHDEAKIELADLEQPETLTPIIASLERRVLSSYLSGLAYVQNQVSQLDHYVKNSKSDTSLKNSQLIYKEYVLFNNSEVIQPKIEKCLQHIETLRFTKSLEVETETAINQEKITQEV
jgi:hypothetical protein